MDIIILIFLCFKIAALAGQKNVSKTRWVLKTILNWIAGEVFGIFLLSYVLMATGRIDPETIKPFGEITKELFFIMCAGLLGGYLGYLFTRKRIEDLPDSNNAIE